MADAAVTSSTTKTLSKWLGYSTTAVLFIGVVGLWWVYTNPLGTNYTGEDWWHLGLALVLALALSYIELQVKAGNFSFASVINFSSMLILPPAFLPLIALALTGIYEYKNPLFHNLAAKIFDTSMFLYIYLLGNLAYHWLGPGSFERITPAMILAVLVAYAVWTLVNYGLIVLRDLVYFKPHPFKILSYMSTEVPLQAVIVPIGLLHSLIVTKDDVLLSLLWSGFLVGTGTFTYRLARLQTQAIRQNQQLLEQKTELEEAARRENSTGQSLAHSATQLGEIALSQSHKISQQFEQLNGISALIYQLNRSATQIADSAARVADSAEQSLLSAQTGQQFLGAGLMALAELDKAIAALADGIGEMSAQSLEIDQLVELIEEISEETHLLAVNATIEASSAGVYGPRFAVVANEVRQLAGRSRQSSQQVQTVVSQLRKAVQKTLVQVERSSEQGQQTDQTMNDTARYTGQIIAATRQTSDLARSIEITTQEQRFNTEQAAQTIRTLLEMAEGSVRLSTRNSETAVELGRLSAGLIGGQDTESRDKKPQAG